MPNMPLNSEEYVAWRMRVADRVLAEVRAIADGALWHPGLNSPHEGRGVIKKAFDALWHEIRADRGLTDAAFAAAVQLAAMAARYVTDLAPDQVDGVLAEVRAEIERAVRKHPPMHSPAEAHAVIEEEFDELWDDIKADRGRGDAALIEAVQLAAMGVRYVADLRPR